MANRDGVNCFVIDGPNFHDVMNSMSASRLGDAFPVWYTIKMVDLREYSLHGKVVGVGWRDTEDTTLFDVRIQMRSRLSQYNPLQPERIDLCIPVYRTRTREGNGSITYLALREIASFTA